jgi:thiosulfate dehydrogenase [quinone] large subunit
MLEQRTFNQTTTDWDRDVVVRAPLYREAAYALLRITLGVVFLFSGFGKFMQGIGTLAAEQSGQFAGKLPSMLVVPFFYALPFVEVAIGALLVLGLLNVFALILSGLLLAALTFGTVMKGDFPTVAHNVSYALVNSALLWLASYNGYSLDRLLHRGRAEYE